ncbi:hypothetical protein BOX24_06375 [Leptospirillum ferriphilum]|jgi:hypothetical protein|uniref:Uncharacterized protein n=1 Tax=Leptospirillum ferriphilum TaxID=178606 RepID=A0A1V3SUS7_9BACT|nr:hypothetical protein BOX24_06375 [Leptospirillum ferriphilum]
MQLSHFSTRYKPYFVDWDGIPMALGRHADAMGVALGWHRGSIGVEPQLNPGSSLMLMGMILAEVSKEHPDGLIGRE